MTQQIRKIQYIIEPRQVIEGAGVRLRRSFAPMPENHFDPFLLFDHFSFKDPVQGPIQGFPMHPHRGIETVTYMLEGYTRHRDSLGNIDTIGPGDVQWMTSGRGIMHEEMPRRDENGHVDGFQLWVNLPASGKMGLPRYQGVLSGQIPSVRQDGVTVRVVAGSYGGETGPVREIAARPLYMDVHMEPDRQFQLDVPRGHTLAVYVFEGEGVFDLSDSSQQALVPSVHMLSFTDGDEVQAKTTANSPLRFLLFAGAPFREPIFAYGPFVMNTREEIIQAMEDLRNGTFVR